MYSRSDIQLDVLEKSAEYPVQILVAPTGFGKSYIFRWAVERRVRVAHVLPLRAVMRSVVEKGASVPGAEKFIAYQASLESLEIEAGGRRVAIARDPFLLAPHIVTTYDSLSFALLVAPTVDVNKVRAHWDVEMLSFANRFIVMDEAHLLGQADDVRSFLPLINIGALSTYLVKHLGCRVVFSSATLSSVYINSLLKCFRLGGGRSSRVVVVGGSTLIDYYKRSIEPSTSTALDFVDVRSVGDGYADLVDAYNRRVATALTELDVGDVVRMGVEGGWGDKLLVVLNTVERAAKVYRELKSCGCGELGSYKLFLLHSRLGVGQREKRSRELVSALNRGEKVIVVATQVIEAGFDEHFDAVVSEAAPLEALIQRFGRVLRSAEDYAVVERENRCVRLVVSASQNSLNSANRVYGKKIVEVATTELSRVVDSSPEALTESKLHFHRIDWRFGEGCTVYSILPALDKIYERCVDAECGVLKYVESAAVEQISTAALGDVRSALAGFEARFEGFIRQGALVPILIPDGDRVRDIVQVSTEFLQRRKHLVLGDGGRFRVGVAVCDEGGGAGCRRELLEYDGRRLDDLIKRPLTTIYRMIMGVRRGEGRVVFEGIELADPTLYSDEYGLAWV